MSRPAARTQPKSPHGLVLYDYGGSPCARRVRITLGHGLIAQRPAVQAQRIG